MHIHTFLFSDLCRKLVTAMPVSFYLYLKKKSDGDADDILGVVIRNTKVIWETRHDVVAYLTAVPQVMK